MASYFISGVWKDNNGRITHVFVHPYDQQNNVFNPGTKQTEAAVIAAIRLGHTYQTLNWSYTDVSWRIGASVGVVQEGGTTYLRTARDASVQDNLDNLINLQGFM